MARGKFITFEGCEGAGKSFQLKLLASYLEKQNIDYIYTREPGGTPISEKIREIILDKDNTDMTDECEALLYAAARFQHLKKTIEPNLANGKLVVCDRYIDSSFAYQGYARGLGMEFIEKINDYAIKNYMPDLTLFLNISSEEAFNRKGGVDASDRVELSGSEFHKKVFKGYSLLIDKYKGRFIPINALGSKQETSKNIINALKENGII